MLELYILATLIIIVVILLYYYSEEPFVVEETSYSLQSCPSGYKSFYDSNGSTNCCNGEIIANGCMGEKQCTLTGTSGPIPNCATFLLQEYKQKGEQCPSSMPHYYENNGKKIKGCTSGSYNHTMDGPANPTDTMCRIYSTLEENITALDSCSNQKEMDEIACFGTNCVKTVTQNAPGQPVLITVIFTDPNGIQRSSHTRASMQRYLDHVTPDWKEKGVMDLSKNVSITEVAKAYYVDKTISNVDV